MAGMNTRIKLEAEITTGLGNTEQGIINTFLCRQEFIYFVLYTIILKEYAPTLTATLHPTVMLD